MGMDGRPPSVRVSPTRKLGIVVGGYVLAVVAGIVAGWLYDLQMAAMPYDNSGGMYAGGQLLASLCVFLVVALVPMLLALWWPCRNTHFRPAVR